MPKWSGHSDTEWKSFVKSIVFLFLLENENSQVFSACGQNVTFSFLIGSLTIELQFQFAKKKFRLKIMLIQLRLKSNSIVLLNKSSI